MKKITLTILCLSIFSLFMNSYLFSDWQEDLDQLLIVETEPEQNALIKEIVSENPDWRDVQQYIKDISFPDVPDKGELIEETTLCTDDVRRPYVLYIPSECDPETPTPMLVVLHGGVNRSELIEDPLSYADEHPLTWMCEEEGWFALYPFGHEGATWWDEVGMANISNLIRTVKKEYNIDDDRIWMGGFSDGASASFLFAMVNPTDYGAFLALNGHMGVGSLAGDLPTYASNYYNTPIYAITTFDDSLYPSDKMRPTIEMGIDAGGYIFYRELEGEHDFAYGEEEIPNFVNFLKSHPRDPFPPKLRWESALMEFGRCKWFAIDETTIGERKDWHIEHNVPMVDERITFGFYPGDGEEVSGIPVDGIVEESSAEEMGIMEGDLIIKCDDFEIENMEDLNEFKGTLNRGDEYSLTVLRDGVEKVLNGELPPPENYYLFKRERPSGMAIVERIANTFYVETSRVGAFRVFISPETVNLNEKIRVVVNDEVLYDEVVEPDLEFMLRDFVENRDRRMLFISEITVTDLED